MDGYQQLVRDFATWRVLNAAEARETDPGKRAWYREDRLRREALILRDIGYLAHYVGDGSQPHHTTIHYNGWNRDTPNPEGFTTSRQTHGVFEGAFTGAGRAAGRGRGGDAGAGAGRLRPARARAAYLKTTLAAGDALLSCWRRPAASRETRSRAAPLSSRRGWRPARPSCAT